MTKVLEECPIKTLAAIDRHDRITGDRGAGMSKSHAEAYAAMVDESAELGWPAHYKDDLLVHDANTFFGKFGKKPERFIWLVRDCGTHLYFQGEILAREALNYHKDAILAGDTIGYIWDGVSLMRHDYNTLCRFLDEKDIVREETTVFEAVIAIPTCANLTASLPYEVRLVTSDAVKEAYEREVCTMIRYAAPTKKETNNGEYRINGQSHISMRLFEDCGSQWVADFCVRSADRKTLYSGGIVIDKETKEVSCHH